MYSGMYFCTPAPKPYFKICAWAANWKIWIRIWGRCVVFGTTPDLLAGALSHTSFQILFKSMRFGQQIEKSGQGPRADAKYYEAQQFHSGQNFRTPASKPFSGICVWAEHWKNWCRAKGQCKIFGTPTKIFGGALWHISFQTLFRNMCLGNKLKNLVKGPKPMRNMGKPNSSIRVCTFAHQLRNSFPEYAFGQKIIKTCRVKGQCEMSGIPTK